MLRVMSVIMGGRGGGKGIFVTRDKRYFPIVIRDSKKYNSVNRDLNAFRES